MERWSLTDEVLRSSVRQSFQVSSPSDDHSSLLMSTRHSLSTSDRSPSPGPKPFTSASPLAAGPSRIGPTLPSHGDRLYALENQREASLALKKSEKALTRSRNLERAEEVAPKLGGREGKIAEKRATNSANKEMRDKEVGGLELDDKTLMGEGGSFQAAYVLSRSSQLVSSLLCSSLLVSIPRLLSVTSSHLPLNSPKEEHLQDGVGRLTAQITS